MSTFSSEMRSCLRASAKSSDGAALTVGGRDEHQQRENRRDEDGQPCTGERRGRGRAFRSQFSEFKRQGLSGSKASKSAPLGRTAVLSRTTRLCHSGRGSPDVIRPRIRSGRERWVVEGTIAWLHDYAACVSVTSAAPTSTKRFSRSAAA